MASASYVRLGGIWVPLTVSGATGPVRAELMGSTGAAPGTDSTTHDVPYSSYEKGDRLLFLVSTDGTPTITAPTIDGVSPVQIYHDNSAEPAVAAYEYQMPGGGSADVATFTLSAAEQAVLFCYRIRGHDEAQAAESNVAATTASASTTAVPSLTPSWAAANTLWITHFAPTMTSTGGHSQLTINFGLARNPGSDIPFQELFPRGTWEYRRTSTASTAGAAGGVASAVRDVGTSPSGTWSVVSSTTNRRVASIIAIRPAG